MSSLHNVWYYNDLTHDTHEVSPDEALRRLRLHRSHVFVDTETIGLKGEKNVAISDWDESNNEISSKTMMEATTCIGVGIAINTHEAYYFPLGKPGWANVPMCDPYPVVQVLEDESVCKVFFNALFDLDRIYETFDIDIDNFEDVAIASQVQGLWNSLDMNAAQILGESHLVIDDVLDKGKTMLDVKFSTTAYKCIMDCLSTARLYYAYKMQDWHDTPLVWTDHIGRKFDVSTRIIQCYRVDHKMIKVLQRMTRRGFALKPDRVLHWYNKLKSELQQYDRYFSEWGINPQSNDQVGWLMLDRGYFIGQTDSGKHYKVDETTLRNLKDPVAHMVLARRTRQKLFGTNIKPFVELDSDGRLIGVKDRAYSHFRLDLATGRLGSWGFNSQNLPPSIREIFAADSGKWLWADLHQAEMRVWAHQAKDPVMLKAFEQGSSPHVETLHYLFPGVPKSNPDGSSTVQYVDSKSYNFALLADASDDILARTTRRPVALVRKLKDELYTLYSKSREHQAFMRVRKQPWWYPDWVEDDYGRRAHIPDASVHVDGTHQEKCRLNYPFQTTVASYVKRAMIGLDLIGIDFPCQVHDEVLQDGDEPFPQWLSELHPAIPMPYEVTGPAPSWV